MWLRLVTFGPSLCLLLFVHRIHPKPKAKTKRNNILTKTPPSLGSEGETKRNNILTKTPPSLDSEGEASSS
jgi:hypothetical protein